MITVNVHEAKTRLSALLTLVEEKHETIRVCRNGKPVARISGAGEPASSHLAAPDPGLVPILNYDPTEVAGPDEWPEARR